VPGAARLPPRSYARGGGHGGTLRRYAVQQRTRRAMVGAGAVDVRPAGAWGRQPPRASEASEAPGLHQAT